MGEGAGWVHCWQSIHMSARVRRTVNHLGRQNINKKKKVELCSLEELDVEGMEGMLSKHAVAKAFLYWESKTVVLVHVYSTYTARPGRFFLPLSRAEIEGMSRAFIAGAVLKEISGTGVSWH